MLSRYLAVLLLALPFFFSTNPASAARYSLSQRQAIRATPILQRPSRPGHVYGNAVRRNAGVYNGR